METGLISVGFVVYRVRGLGLRSCLVVGEGLVCQRAAGISICSDRETLGESVWSQAVWSLFITELQVAAVFF